MGGRAGHIVVAVVVLSVVASSGLLAATATSSYSVEATSSIDTPTRTITIEGDDYNVSSLGSIDEGQTLEVAASRPGDSIFTIYLYNTDKQIVDSVRRNENGTYSLDTASLSPGTYVAALDVDGTIQTIQPVVISGHDFSVDAPSSVQEGDSISVTATVSNGPYRVDVVLYNESWSRTVSAARIGDGEYNRIIDGDLAPGEYSLYVVARGEETFDGEHELTGLSPVQTVQVEGTSDSTTTQTASSTTTASPTTESTTRATAGTSTTATTAVTTQLTRTTTEPASTTPQTSPPTTAPGSAGDNSTVNATTAQSTTAATTEAGTVITPGTDSSPTTTSTNTPGFTVGTALVALLLLGWRQR